MQCNRDKKVIKEEEPISVQDLLKKVTVKGSQINDSIRKKILTNMFHQ